MTLLKKKQVSRDRNAALDQGLILLPAILQLVLGINNSCADRRQKNHLKTDKYYPIEFSK